MHTQEWRPCFTTSLLLGRVSRDTRGRSFLQGWSNHLGSCGNLPAFLAAALTAAKPGMKGALTGSTITSESMQSPSRFAFPCRMAVVCRAAERLLRSKRLVRLSCARKLDCQCMLLTEERYKVLPSGLPSLLLPGQPASCCLQACTPCCSQQPAEHQPGSQGPCPHKIV